MGVISNNNQNTVEKVNIPNILGTLQKSEFSVSKKIKEKIESSLTTSLDLNENKCVKFKVVLISFLPLGKNPNNKIFFVLNFNSFLFTTFTTKVLNIKYKKYSFSFKSKFSMAGCQRAITCFLLFFWKFTVNKLNKILSQIKKFHLCVS